MFKLTITATDDVFGDNRDIVVVEKTYGYQDVDMFEMANPDFAYKFAEICREEIEKIKKERFLEENPEYRVGGEIDELKASTPF